MDKEKFNRDVKELEEMGLIQLGEKRFELTDKGTEEVKRFVKRNEGMNLLILLSLGIDK